MPVARVREDCAIWELSNDALNSSVGETLRGFLAGGGGLLIEAGDDVNPSVVSTLLEWQPPLALHDMRTVGVLAATDLRHPVLRPFDAVAADFGQVGFERAWQIDPGWSRRVVARYTNGATALAERAGSPGRVLLFTSDVDHRWNDFPLNPAFVPFAQEVARYLGARAPAVSAYLVADVPPGVAPRPGLAMAGHRLLAINVDPRESSAERGMPAQVQTLPRRSSGAGQPRAVRLAQQTEGQQNYWRYGLMLMLGVLVVEAFVGSR